MHKIPAAALITLSLCLAVFIASTSFALSFTNVGKAEDKITEALNLRKNGLNDEASQRISDAIGLLNDTLAKEPDNHKAQYLLGQCYWMQGSEGKALDLFRRASEASEYKPKVVAFIKDETDLAGSRGDYKRVFRLYEYTVQIDPSEKAAIVDKLKADADSILKAGKYELASIYYRTLLQYDPSANVQSGDAFFAAGEQNPDPKSKLHLYRTALQFDPSKRQNVIDASAEVAKGDGNKYLEPDVKRFPSDVSMEIVSIAWPPDWIEFGLGYHEIKNIQSKTGSLWLRPKDGIRGKINFAGKDNDFILLIRNRDTGEIKKIDWANGERTWDTVHADYKIVPNNSVMNVYFIFKK